MTPKAEFKNKMQRQPMKQEKISVKHIFKSLIYEICKELTYSIAKKQLANFKIDWVPEQIFFQRIHTNGQGYMKRCPTSLVIRKCKLKPQ